MSSRRAASSPDAADDEVTAHRMPAVGGLSDDEATAHEMPALDDRTDRDLGPPAALEDVDPLTLEVLPAGSDETQQPSALMAVGAVAVNPVQGSAVAGGTVVDATRGAAESEDLPVVGDPASDSQRRRRSTVTEGPAERDLLARTGEQPLPTLAPADLPVAPQAPATAADASSLRLRPDLAAAAKRRRPPSDARRDVPTVLSLDTVVPAAVAPQRLPDTEVTRGGAQTQASPWQAGGLWMALGAALALALLIGIGAWLAIRVDARLATEERQRNAAQAIESVRRQQAAVAAQVEAASAATDEAHVLEAPAPPAAPSGPAGPVADAEPPSSAEPTPSATPSSSGDPPPAAPGESDSETPPTPQAAPSAQPARGDPAAKAAEEQAPVAALAKPTAADVANKAVVEEAHNRGKKATHEVTGTAADAAAPWLALRARPAPTAPLRAELPDHTPLRVLRRHGRWFAVEVQGGPLRGKRGWVHSGFVTPLSDLARP